MSNIAISRRHKKLTALFTFVFIFVSTFLYLSSPVSAIEPSGKINLKPWKLTLPVNSSGGLGGSAAEIKGRDLTSYVNKPWYEPVKSAGKLIGVKFYAVDKGATTSSSGNPRSELREMTSTGSTEYNWSPYSGTHRMLIKQKVYNLTGRQHVVIGQIHDKDSDTIDDYAVFRLQGTQLWAYIDGSTSSGKSKLLDGNVRLNQVITVGFMVKNGTITMYYDKTGSANPKAVHTVAYPKGSVGGAYFKAGSYCQCGTGKGYSGSAGVEILGLGVTHNGLLPDIGPPSTTTPTPTPTPLTGEKLTGTMTEALCKALDRNVLTISGVKYCAKRTDGRTTPGAAECVAPKTGYAKFTYIVDSSGDYCGYW